MCDIFLKDLLVDLIRRARLIIWKEALMMHKHCFEIVDRTLKDILHVKNTLFGEKVVVLGVDFFFPDSSCYI